MAAPPAIHLSNESTPLWRFRWGTSLALPAGGRATASAAGGITVNALLDRRIASLIAAVVLTLGATRAEAAPALVKNVGVNNSLTAGTSIAVTVPAAGVAAGNTIIVTFAMDAGPTPVAGDVTCADNGVPANTYTKNADVRNGTGTSGVRTVVFSAPVTTALAAGKTITVSFPSTTAKAVSVNEFSRLVAPTPADQSGTATGATNAPSATTSPNATTQAEELVIGAFGREGKGNEFGAVGSGFTGLT